MTNAAANSAHPPTYESAKYPAACTRKPQTRPRTATRTSGSNTNGSNQASVMTAEPTAYISPHTSEPTPGSSEASKPEAPAIYPASMTTAEHTNEAGGTYPPTNENGRRTSREPPRANPASTKATSTSVAKAPTILVISEKEVCATKPWLVPASAPKAVM